MALLQEPPPRGTSEQHQPALPFGKRGLGAASLVQESEDSGGGYSWKQRFDAIASSQIVRAAILLATDITSQLLS